MLVENKALHTRSIGPISLIPGINSIVDEEWDKVAKSAQFERAVKGLQEDDIIKVMDNRKKLTIETVKKTADLGLLHEWLANPAYKGPLKGAIKLQIDEIESIEDKV